MKDCIVWGATGQAKMLRPIIERAGYGIVAIFDNDPAVPPPFKDIPLRGAWQDFLSLRPKMKSGTAFAIAIGGEYGNDRCALGDKLKAEGLTPLTLVHETAHAAKTATLGEGTQVLPLAAVCEEARLGRHCIVNTNASVDHECVLGDGIHVMPGATIAGAVRIGNFTTIGSNVTILPRITRGLRFYLVAGLLYWMGPPAREFIEKRLELIFVVFLVIFVLGFVAAIYVF